MRQRPLFAKTAEVMHACIEPRPMTFEGLQPATDDSVFLEDGHMTACTREESACDQASHTTSDDEDTMLILYCQNS